MYTENTVKAAMGERLRMARECAGLTQKRVAELLNASKKAPLSTPGKELLQGTYIGWENGRNKVDIEWIPALCDVLGVDVGYLFGEYPEKTRTASDLCAVTGLSEKGAAGLIQVYKADSVDDDWNYTHPPYQPDSQQYRDNIHYVVDDILSTSSGHDFLKALFKVWKKRQFIRCLFDDDYAFSNLPEKARKRKRFRSYYDVDSARSSLDSAVMGLYNAAIRFADDVYDYRNAHKQCDNFMEKVGE